MKVYTGDRSLRPLITPLMRLSYEGDGERDNTYATKPFQTPEHVGKWCVNVHDNIIGGTTMVLDSLADAVTYRDYFDNWDRLTARVKAVS